MKYKRPRPKTQYVSNSAKAKNERKASLIKRRSTAIAAAIMLMFSLSRLGVFKKTPISGGELLERLGSFSKEKTGNRIFGNLSEGIADFCFNFLRGEKKESKASVYAREKKLLQSDAEPYKSETTEAPIPEEIPSVPTASGFMPIMPCMGEVSSEFGERVHPVSGEQSFHNGIDIAVSEGSEIYACEGGTVILAEYNEFSGNHIKIEHQGGYVSSYSHLRSCLAETGDTVQRGELIGLAGSTGVATGPHLHFEILKSGEVQNPRDLISR